MIAESIPLRFAGPTRVLRLRELTGRDERAVSGVTTADAIRLLDALSDSRFSSEGEQIRAAELVAADRDRLLAAVYERAFGDRIESTLTCVRCAQPFDIHFSLHRLTDSLHERKAMDEWKPLGDGRFEGSDGIRFRLPTGYDELAGAGLPHSEMESLLLNRCTENGGWREHQIAFEELLEKIAPLLHLDLTAPCAECGHVHTFQFDIQSYLLGAIIDERWRLMTEIHRIAAAYAWSLDEILSVSRSERRQLVHLIETKTLQTPRFR